MSSSSGSPTNTVLTTTFMCHSGASKPFVREVNLRLVRDHDIKTFYDEHSIPIGAELSDVIYRAIKAARIAVVFCCQTFFDEERGKWPQAELNQILARRNRGEPLSVMPVVIDLTHERFKERAPQLHGIKYHRIESQDKIRVQTTVDFIVDEYKKRLPILKELPAKEALTSEVRQDYLKWLIDQTKKLEIRGLQSPRGGTLTVPLEQMYVALKVDPTQLEERMAAREALQRDIDNYLGDGAASQEEADHAAWWALANVPLADYVESRLRIESFVKETVSMNVAEAVSKDSTLVILGDPGSGKTTIARWLTLVHAESSRQGESHTSVPRHSVVVAFNNDGETEGDIVLGPAKLPVLIRVAEYAEYYSKCTHNKDTVLSLSEFLGHHSWYNSYPTWTQGNKDYHANERIPPAFLKDMVNEALQAGEAIVILDGLDEIPTSCSRSDILRSVQELLQLKFRGSSNQLIVTSRIAGYHLTPLGDDFTHVTIEPMQETAVSCFVHKWMQGVEKLLNSSSDGTEEKSANEQAQNLLNLLKLPSGKYASELMTNPLLASVIATVYYSGKGTLPTNRVQLYQAAIGSLVDVWYDREQPSRTLNVNRHELFTMLPNVAYHIHERKPTGFIGEEELRNYMLRQLSTIRMQDPNRPRTQEKVDLDTLFVVLRDDVGLLAAGGTGIYRFLHLTFQEYLAGQGFFSDLSQVPHLFRKKSLDPRWREPILMGLGYFDLTLPQEVLKLVNILIKIESPLDDFFPQATLLLIDAIRQMRNASFEVVSIVVRSALTTYDRLSRSSSLEETTETIVRSLGKLCEEGQSRTTFERVCLDRLSTQGCGSGTGEVVANTAELVRKIGLTSKALADGLTKVLCFENPTVGYKVTETLTWLLSPASSDTTIPRLEWLQPRLTIRQALLRKPELTSFVRKDMEWMMLLATICGGYWNLWATERFHEYRQMEVFLGMASNERLRFKICFEEQFGREDFVYQMAMLLVTDGEEWKRRWTTPPRFHPETIVREPEFAPLILRALRRGDSAKSLLQDLLQLMLTPGKSQADAAAAAWCLDSTNTIFREPEVRKLLQCRLGAVSTSLRDSAARGVTRATNYLNQVGKLTGPLRHLQAYDCFVSVILSCGSDQIDYYVSSAELAPRLIAEALVTCFTGSLRLEGCDALSQSLNSRFSPRQLLAGLNEIGRTCPRVYTSRSWSGDHFSFSTPVNDRDDVPTHVLDLIEALRSAPLFPDWLLNTIVVPMFGLGQHLQNEVLIVMLSSFCTRDYESRIASLFPAIRSSDNFWRAALSRQLELNLTISPYHAARSLIRLGKMVPTFQFEVTALIPGLLNQVEEPLCKFELCENLFLYWLNSIDKKELLGNCCTSANLVVDPVDRMRAWCRVARLADGEERTYFLKLAVQSVERVESQTMRSMLLLQLRERYWDQPSILGSIDRICSDLLDPIDRDFACAARGSVLLQYFTAIPDSEPETANEHWTPMVLCARWSQLKDETSREHLAWCKMALNPTVANVKTVKMATKAELIVCSGAVARCLDSAVDNSGAARVQPLVVRLVEFDADAEGLVRKWCCNKSSLSSMAALLVSERYGLSIDCLPYILDLLVSRNDMLRSRAEKVVSSPDSDLIHSVTMLSPNVVEELWHRYESVVGEQGGCATRIGWHTDSLLHDDTKAFDVWCDLIEIAEPSRYVVPKHILSSIKRLTTPVWNCLLERYRQGSVQLRSILITSIAIMVYLSHANKSKEHRVDQKREDQLWEMMQKCGGQENTQSKYVVMLQDVFETVSSVLDQTQGDVSDDIATMAERTLRERCIISFQIEKVVEDGREKFLSNLGRLGKSYYVTHNLDRHAYVLSQVQQWIDQSKIESPRWVEVSVRWLCAALQRSSIDTAPFFVRSFLLELTAAAAELHRAYFRQVVNKNAMEMLLSDATQFGNSYPGRASAIRLLGFLNAGTWSTLTAFKAALGDVALVQTAAIDAASCLSHMDDNILPDLFDLLYDESAVVAHATAQLIVSMGQNPKLPQPIRTRIIDAFAQAARDERSRRKVYFHYVHASIPDMPMLDESFVVAMRKVCQIG